MPTLTTTQGAPNIIKDPNLKVELVFEGLELPTSMAFLGPDDILVLEKDKGTVQRIVNGKMLPEPILDVNVANKSERGMLGIAVTNNGTTNNIYVFLYFTESVQDGNDDCPKDDFCNPGNDPLGNRLYRYELVNDQLTNPVLLLDLPATSGPAHNGGAITIGPDNNVYLPIGELREEDIQKVSSADGRGGILRVTQDGEIVGVGGEGQGILGNIYPLNLYYAYGIRNSFGIDFDPVTATLWDTENGPGFGDEINLVQPGFNSGWNEVQGIWPREGGPSEDIILNPDGLLEFGGKVKYSAPEFTWIPTIGPTALKFLNSDKLGMQYQNDIFIGDVHNGRIYHFDLNEARTGLVLEGPLDDKVADDDGENEDIVFGEGFGSISDLEIGPDGYLYVVSIGLGGIYRIVPGGGANGNDGVTVAAEDINSNIGTAEDGISDDEEG
jgi:glucose/arabinose dehydrogenase